MVILVKTKGRSKFTFSKPIPIHKIDGMTEQTRAIIEAIRAVPPGKVSSYGAVARADAEMLEGPPRPHPIGPAPRGARPPKSARQSINCAKSVR